MVAVSQEVTIPPFQIATFGSYLNDLELSPQTNRLHLRSLRHEERIKLMTQQLS